MAASVSFSPVSVSMGGSTVYTAPVANVFVTISSEGDPIILGWLTGSTIHAASVIKAGESVVWGPLASGDVVLGCCPVQSGSGSVIVGEVHP